MPNRGDKNAAGQVWNGAGWTDPKNVQQSGVAKSAPLTETATSGATLKGKNLGVKEKPVDANAPKQQPGEDAASFAKRFREYREARAK